jgi:hypothetical protein
MEPSFHKETQRSFTSLRTFPRSSSSGQLWRTARPWTSWILPPVYASALSNKPYEIILPVPCLLIFSITYLDSRPWNKYPQKWCLTPVLVLLSHVFEALRGYWYIFEVLRQVVRASSICLAAGRHDCHEWTSRKVARLAGCSCKLLGLSCILSSLLFS